MGTLRASAHELSQSLLYDLHANEQKVYCRLAMKLAN